jgi:NAD-dependent dihydropyrimidine dehydrogenase PreA subunit
MKRDIIKINEDLCNGCGLCVPSCHEGALQVIDGKVRLVSELMCDGLGACIGHCPEGAITIEKSGQSETITSTADQPSELRQWPVQMHLVNPNAPYFRNADLLLAADCVAFSTGNFHSRFLKGKSLAIACPKLDHGADIYVEKLIAMIETAKVNTITVMMMEVPCCGGLLQMVHAALAKSSRKVPVKQMIVSITGEVLRDEWV